MAAPVCGVLSSACFVAETVLGGRLLSNADARRGECVIGGFTEEGRHQDAGRDSDYDCRQGTQQKHLHRFTWSLSSALPLGAPFALQGGSNSLAAFAFPPRLVADLVTLAHLLELA